MRLSQIVEDCVKFYEKNETTLLSDKTLKNRFLLSNAAIMLHSKTNTLTNSVKENIELLHQKKPTLIIMTAHQPNLFPYSGVMRKIVLGYALEQELRHKYGLPVVSYFGFADQDITGDRWLKTAQIPSISKKEGTFSLNYNLPDNHILNSIKNPTNLEVEKWSNDLSIWFEDTSSYIKKRLPAGNEWRDYYTQLKNNTSEVINIINDSNKNIDNYADYNSSFVMKIANNVWNYDTIFTNFSDVQKNMIFEFEYLVNNIEKYSNILNNLEVNLEASNVLPFWYHCDCGSKVRLYYNTSNNEVFSKGNCLLCNKEYEFTFNSYKPNLRYISDKISARAISMILIFSMGIGLTCYIGGMGGMEYLKKATMIGEALDVIIPVICYWRPKDEYFSVSDLELCLLVKEITENYDVKNIDFEIKKIYDKIENVTCNLNKLEDNKQILINEYKSGKINLNEFKLKISLIGDELNNIKRDNHLNDLRRNLVLLDNVKKYEKIMPSIIDYGVNIGLKNTGDEWLSYLLSDGSFEEDVKLNSVLRQNILSDT